MSNPAWRARWGTLDLGFSNIKLRLFALDLALPYRKDSFFFFHPFHHFFFLHDFRLLTVWLFYLTDKTQVTPRISLINVPALNYLRRSQIFVNNDGQLRATHLILDYEPILRTFLDVGNSIRANDYRLARIDVSRPGFLALHDFPLVDHPVPQGIPLAAQALQQVPLAQAIAEEGATSSSSL